MALPQKRSIFGRLFGLGFSDEPLSNFNRVDVGQISTNVSSSGATIPNSGFNPITSSATAANLLLAAPTEGCRTEIYLNTSASLVTISAASSAFTIGTSSSAVSWTAAALKNNYIVLRGLGSTMYGVISQSTLATLA